MSEEDALRVLHEMPVGLGVLAVAAIGFVVGFWLYPVPPISNVEEAAAVQIVILFAGALAFMEVRSRV